MSTFFLNFKAKGGPNGSKYRNKTFIHVSYAASIYMGKINAIYKAPPAPFFY